MLDFISKHDNLEKNILDALKTAHQILFSHKFFAFRSNSEIRQIMYNEILFIEKNLRNNSSTFHLKSGECVVVYESINHLFDTLKDDIRFMKVHRSCIVNLDNIRSFKIKDNIINFGGDSTHLLSRSKKKELEEILIKMAK